MEDLAFNVVFQTAKFVHQRIPARAVLRAIHCTVEHAKYVLILIVSYVRLTIHVRVASICIPFIVDLVFLVTWLIASFAKLLILALVALVDILCIVALATNALLMLIVSFVKVTTSVQLALLAIHYRVDLVSVAM